MDKKSLRLFFSLMIWTLVPSVYLIIRMNIISINNVDINILGQIEWFDLIDEILITTLVTPLYALIKPNKDGKLNGTTIPISFIIYLLFASIVYFNILNISKYMI